MCEWFADSVLLCVVPRLIRGIFKTICSFGKTQVSSHKKTDWSSCFIRIPQLMTCISMCNDEKINLFTGFLSVSQCSFSAFWQAENAAHSSTGRMKSKILYILVLRLEISTKTTSFSLLLLQKMWFLKTVYIFICTVYSVCPMLFLQYCLWVSFYKNMFCTDKLNKECLS